MIEIIRTLFDSTGLGPHGMCLVWREDLLALHIFSDGLIALSYFTIPFFLFVVAYRRRDLIFRGTFNQFSAFIMLCGMTHLFAIWTMWNPDYIEFGLLKLATALVSATTALTLWRILPQVLVLPSPAQLRQANLQLEKEAHDRRQAETSAHENHERLMDAVESMSEGFAIYDKADRLVMCNRKYRELHGDNASKIEPGMPLKTIVDLDLAAGVYVDAKGREADWIAERFDARRRMDRTMETRLADGRWLMIDERPMKNGGTADIQTDITAIKTQEEQLYGAQKMEALGQLTGGIAHDFNNLLGIILGNLQLLQDRIEEGDKRRGFVDAAVKATMRGADLIQRLLAFSRRQPLNTTNTDINRAVTGISELLFRTLKADIGIKTDFAENLGRAKIDEAQLESAILNLVLNAQHAMPDGGTLTIETANVTVDESAALQAEKLPPGEYVMLAVSDTGVGMTAEVLGQAFDPFFTTKPVGEGSGLGLSMVYGLVKQLGGHARIYSEPGCGTTVKLYFPRTESEPALPQPPPVADTAAAVTHHRVLLVEDEAELREVTSRILTDLGYQVVEAADGAEALDIVRNLPDIDLVLTDVVLPGGMNGIDVAKAVCDLLQQDIPVVYVTGYTDRASKNGNIIPPDADILTKPYTRNALDELIRGVLNP